MMHGNDIWESGIGEIAKTSRGTAPGPHKEGLHCPIWTPSCKGQHKPSYFGGLSTFVLLIFSMFIFLLVFRKSTIHSTLTLWSKWVSWGFYMHETESLYSKNIGLNDIAQSHRRRGGGGGQGLISWGELIMYYRPGTIKLNPWLKTEVSKSALIKPCI